MINSLFLKSKLVLLILLIQLMGCASTYIPEDILFNTDNSSNLEEFIENYGPPFSVTQADDGYTITYYGWHQGSMNALTMIPFVGVVAGGMDVKMTKFEITFNSDDSYATHSSSFAEGYFNNLLNLRASSFEADSLDRLGKFLFKKTIFFSQEKWEFQQRNAYIWQTISD